MVANALKSHLFRSKGNTFFASGVSNSQCNDVKQFTRERELLLDELGKSDPKKFFIYFGTCSIFDPDEYQSSYVQHKLSLEKILLSIPNGLIARLPQVAGNSGSQSNFCNWLFSNIRAETAFTVYDNTTRNVIDIQHAIEILDHYLESKPPNDRIINIGNPKSYPVTYFVKAAEKLLNKKANYIAVARGSTYNFDTTTSAKISHSLGISFDSNYTENVFSKYFA